MSDAFGTVSPTKPNSGKALAPDTKRLAALEKGRATQAHARGKINASELNAIHTKANRAIGHTFHSLKGQG